jgi:hypothetical protein
MSKPQESDLAFAQAIGEVMARTMEPIVRRMEELEKKGAPLPRIGVDELATKVLGEIRGEGRPAPAIEELFALRSEDTGATFDVFIQGGKVSALPNYRYPEGIDKHASEGGLVPQGMSVTEEGDDWGYRLWRTKEFWIKDLTRFVGKPLPPSMRAQVQQKQAAE